MPVSQKLAERLLAHAKGVAVDLLFPHAVHIEYTPATQPSSELLVQRWSSLPAASAAKMAGSITDTDALDLIAAKEKRKTVRLELASNQHLHPVTRLFYVQEAARTNDHDLLRSALAGMSPSELLGYVQAKDPIVRYVRYDNVVRRIVAAKDVALLQAYAAALEPREFAAMCESAVHQQPVVALELIEQAGVRPERLELSRYMNIPVENVSLWKMLYRIDPENVATQIMRAFAHCPQRLPEIDPALVRNLLRQRRYSLEHVRTLVDNDLLDELLAEDPRLESSAADWLAEQLDDSLVRARIIVRHPEPGKSVRHIHDLRLFASMVAREVDHSSVLQWLGYAAETVGLDGTVTVLHEVLTTPANRSLPLRHDLLSTLANRTGTDVDTFLSALCDDLFARIESFPEMADPQRALERAERLGNDLDCVVAVSVLAYRDSDPALQVRAAEIVIANNKWDELVRWLAASPAELVHTVIGRHRALVAALVTAHRELQRAPWANDLIDALVPRGGWGSVRSDNLLASAMDYLDARIGSDRRVWEAALVLFENWTGSLDDLVTTARAI